MEAPRVRAVPSGVAEYAPWAQGLLEGADPDASALAVLVYKPSLYP